MQLTKSGFCIQQGLLRELPDPFRRSALLAVGDTSTQTLRRWQHCLARAEPYPEIVRPLLLLQSAVGSETTGMFPPLGRSLDNSFQILSGRLHTSRCPIVPHARCVLGQQQYVQQPE